MRQSEGCLFSRRTPNSSLHPRVVGHLHNRPLSPDHSLLFRRISYPNTNDQLTARPQITRFRDSDPHIYQIYPSVACIPIFLMWPNHLSHGHTPFHGTCPDVSETNHFSLPYPYPFPPLVLVAPDCIGGGCDCERAMATASPSPTLSATPSKPPCHGMIYPIDIDNLDDSEVSYLSPSRPTESNADRMFCRSSMD